jgi:hypothetical protein
MRTTIGYILTVTSYLIFTCKTDWQNGADESSAKTLFVDVDEKYIYL